MFSFRISTNSVQRTSSWGQKVSRVVCDGNVTLSMEAGYTYIPFGTLDPEYGVDSNSGSYVPMVPDRYSFNAISAPAYTFDLLVRSLI